MAEQERKEVRTTSWWRFPGWQMVLAGALHGFGGYGFWFYGWSAFVPVLQRQYGFTAAEIGLGRTVSRMDVGVEGIFTGWALDKWGPRFTAIFGFVYCSIGYLAIAQLGVFRQAWGSTGALLAMLFFYGLVISNSFGISLYTTSYPAINRWFVRRRANAMGLIATGTGVGSTFLVPVSAWMVATWGLEGACYAIIAVNLLILTPLALLFRPHQPEHYGFFPDNVTVEVAQSQSRLERAMYSKVQFTDFTLKQAMRTRGFWGICLASGAAGYGSTALTLFQNIRMQAVGYSTQVAANFYGFQFTMTVVGRVLVAAFGELVDPYHVMWMTHALMTVGLLLFAVGTEDWHFYGWAILYGIPYGAWTPTIGTLRGSYFGRKYIGTVYGWISAIAGTIGMPQGVIQGWMIDAYGMSTAFLIGTGATALATVLYIWGVRPRTQPSPSAIKRAAKEAEEELRRSGVA